MIRSIQDKETKIFKFIRDNAPVSHSRVISRFQKMDDMATALDNLITSKRIFPFKNTESLGRPKTSYYLEEKDFPTETAKERHEASILAYIQKHRIVEKYKIIQFFQRVNNRDEILHSLILDKKIWSVEKPALRGAAGLVYGPMDEPIPDYQATFLANKEKLSFKKIASQIVNDNVFFPLKDQREDGVAYETIKFEAYENKISTDELLRLINEITSTDAYKATYIAQSKKYEFRRMLENINKYINAYGYDQPGLEAFHDYLKSEKDRRDKENAAAWRQINIRNGLREKRGEWLDEKLTKELMEEYPDFPEHEIHSEIIMRRNDIVLSGNRLIKWTELEEISGDQCLSLDDLIDYEWAKRDAEHLETKKGYQFKYQDFDEEKQIGRIWRVK